MCGYQKVLLPFLFHHPGVTPLHDYPITRGNQVLYIKRKSWEGLINKKSIPLHCSFKLLHCFLFPDAPMEHFLSGFRPPANFTVVKNSSVMWHSISPNLCNGIFQLLQRGWLMVLENDSVHEENPHTKEHSRRLPETVRQIILRSLHWSHFSTPCPLRLQWPACVVELVTKTNSSLPD